MTLLPPQIPSYPEDPKDDTEKEIKVRKIDQSSQTKKIMASQPPRNKGLSRAQKNEPDHFEQFHPPKEVVNLI